MLLRRALYVVQFPLAVLLPLWVLLSRGIFADGIGWSFLGYLVLSPILFLALASIVGLVSARKTVRVQRAVSWLDAALLGALTLTLVAYGLFALPVLAALAVLLVVGGVWLELWQLFTETRGRVRQYLDPSPQQIPDLIVVPPERLSR